MPLNQCVLAQLTGGLVRLAVRRNNYTVESYAVPGRSRPPSAHTSGTPIITPNLLREPKRWTICSQAWLDFVIEIQTHDTSSESKSGFCQNQRYPIVVSVAPPHWEQFKPFFFAPSSSTFGSRTIPPADHSHLLPHEPKHIASSQLAVRFCHLESTHPPIRQGQLMPALVLLW